jgi:hypothetical protein
LDGGFGHLVAAVLSARAGEITLAQEVSSAYKGTNQMKTKNVVTRLSDGRVEVIFAQPMSEGDGKRLILAFGHRRGNQILRRKGRAIGVRCHPSDFEDFIVSVGGTRTKQNVEEFRAALAAKPPKP